VLIRTMIESSQKLVADYQKSRARRRSRKMIIARISRLLWTIPFVIIIFLFSFAAYPGLEAVDVNGDETAGGCNMGSKYDIA
jgi:hypothetical protein